MNKDWSDLKSMIKYKGHDLSLNKSGRISFNRMFFNNSLKCKYVSLSYSKNNSAIIFKFKAEKETSICNLKITHNKTDGAITIGIERFMKFMQIDQEKYCGKYNLISENIPKIGKSWVLYLKENS